MRVGIDYAVVKSNTFVLVSATISKLVKEPQSKTRNKLDHDMVRWIIFPEWCEKGLFLKNITDFSLLGNTPLSFKNYFEVEKDFDLEVWNFKEIKPIIGEKEETVSIEAGKVQLVGSFNTIVKKGDFELHQLVKKKELESPVKKRRKRTKYSDINLAECDEF